ncbi:hypothetical protein [Enterovibrio norvegicus]|uniref:hypothetical protein n=1 Tax=Enterovibrio norvegicus TaxID=188144 RepID=UPI001F53BED6|nr:hypothetical protein [Enterovibrio norvegicus]
MASVNSPEGRPSSGCLGITVCFAVPTLCLHSENSLLSSNTEHKIDSSPNDSCPIRKTAFAQGARFHVHDSADIQLKLNVLSLAESRLNTIQLSLFATNLRCYGDFVLNNNETLEITMKKTLTAVLVMLASSSAFAQAPTTELSVTTVRGGAFVQ